MRVPVLRKEELSPRQKEVLDRILARRGQAGGPYPVWLRIPEPCERAEALSAYVRFECSLPLKLRELSILLTARFWDAQYSWNAHVDKARAIFGAKGVVDLIGSIGYFTMLQICLNSAEVDLQADRKPPFPDMRGYRKVGAGG